MDSSWRDKQKIGNEKQRMPNCSKAWERHTWGAEIGNSRAPYFPWMVQGVCSGEGTFRLKLKKTRRSPPCGSCWKSASDRGNSMWKTLRLEQRANLGLECGGWGGAPGADRVKDSGFHSISTGKTEELEVEDNQDLIQLSNLAAAWRMDWGSCVLKSSWTCSFSPLYGHHPGHHPLLLGWLRLLLDCLFMSVLPPCNAAAALGLEWSLHNANLVFFRSCLETCSGCPLLVAESPHPLLCEAGAGLALCCFPSFSCWLSCPSRLLSQEASAHFLNMLLAASVPLHVLFSCHPKHLALHFHNRHFSKHSGSQTF